MGNYQLLFSGEITTEANQEVVKANVGRLLGVQPDKAQRLFSGRTVVLKSNLSEAEAMSWQAKLSDVGAITRVKNLAPETKVDDGPAVDRERIDYTLRDITAAHVECPRCGYMQLESSHCSRCGVDVALLNKQKRKEDQIIERKIRALRQKDSPAPQAVKPIFAPSEDAPTKDVKRTSRLGKIGSWVKRKA